MSEVALIAKARTGTGKSANRQLRVQKLIPANLYGPGLSSMLSLVEKDARRFLGIMTGPHQLVDLTVEDDAGKKTVHKVLVSEAQRHPYKDEVIHLDFRVLDPSKPVKLQVPMVTVGTAPGIKAGGLLQMIQRTVPVICTPDNIPEVIEADVSELYVKDSLRVHALSYPANVKSAAKQNYTVLACVGRRALEVEPTEEAEAEAEATEEESA